MSDVNQFNRLFSIDRIIAKKVKLKEMKGILDKWFVAVQVNDVDLCEKLHDEYYARKTEFDKIGKVRHD